MTIIRDLLRFLRRRDSESAFLLIMELMQWLTVPHLVELSDYAKAIKENRGRVK